MNIVYVLVLFLGLVAYMYLETTRDSRQAADFMSLVCEKSNGARDSYSIKAAKKFENSIKKGTDSREHLYGALLYDYNLNDAEKALENYMLSVQLSNDRDSTFNALNRLRDFVHRSEKDLDEQLLARAKEYEFKAIAKYKEEAAVGYDFIEEDNMPEIAGDPQNVHDFAVYKDLNKKLDYLRKMYATGEECLTEKETRDSILEFISSKTNCDTNRKMRRVKKILRQFSYDNEIDGFGSDLFCLQMVWSRAVRTGNENLKDAIIDMLAESMNDRGEITCVMGRCTRLVDSMTMIDDDENLKYPVQSTSMIRQEIFNRAAEILKEQLDHFKTSVPVESEHHEDYSDFVQRYEKGDDLTEPQLVKIEAQFKSQLRIKLGYLLDLYQDKLSQPTLDLIRQEIEIGYGLLE